MVQASSRIRVGAPVANRHPRNLVGSPVKTDRSVIVMATEEFFRDTSGDTGMHPAGDKSVPPLGVFLCQGQANLEVHGLPTERTRWFACSAVSAGRPLSALHLPASLCIRTCPVAVPAKTVLAQPSRAYWAPAVAPLTSAATISGKYQPGGKASRSSRPKPFAPCSAAPLSHQMGHIPRSRTSRA